MEISLQQRYLMEIILPFLNMMSKKVKWLPQCLAQVQELTRSPAMYKEHLSYCNYRDWENMDFEFTIS